MKVEISNGALRLTTETEKDLFVLGMIVGANAVRVFEVGSGRRCADVSMEVVLKRLGEPERRQ